MSQSFFSIKWILDVHVYDYSHQITMEMAKQKEWQINAYMQFVNKTVHSWTPKNPFLVYVFIFK